MTAITVNGVEIREAAIAAETQNHPASSPQAARRAAAEVLVVRELLVQEARRRGIEAAPLGDEQGRRETDEEAIIRQLVEREVPVPEADEASCRRFFENNRERFRSPDLFEAAHILYAAPPDDEAAYAAAAERAQRAIAALREAPQLFAELARSDSACPSGANGGKFGQITRGQTVPEFETFLINLEEGQLCPVPVRTRFGAHVLRLDRRIAGRELPFEAVRARVSGYLAERSWRNAVSLYLRHLASRAEIAGIEVAVSANLGDARPSP